MPLNATSAYAQATSSGTITGTVLDPTGAVVVGATVTVTDPATKTKRTTVSNKDGQYVLSNIQPGTYDVTAAKGGFSMDQIIGLVVSVGSQTNANFKMVVGAESTTVDVQASNADLQTMSATTGNTVDSALVEALPALQRDVSTFVTLQPGVTPGGNVAGTTVDQTTFTLDGGSNTSDMDGTAGVYTQSTAGTTTGGFIGAGASGAVPMPQDSIEEFKVATTGQTADFNNSSGSQSQIVTKRGRDRWTGTAYEYYMDNNIGGNTWQNNFKNAYTPKPSYHYNRYGGAAGGPIAPFFLGGKTYFFANFEGFSYPLAQTFERTVPSYEFLQLGQMTLGANTYSAAQLKAADPRGIGMNPTLTNYYKTQMPVAPVGDNGPSSPYIGTFDKSCGALSGSICDSLNFIGYKANILTKQSSNFLATRVDHDFGAKWHLMLSYRYYNFQNLTANQVDFGGGYAGDVNGTPIATAPRPTQPSFYVAGLTTNISSSLTNDFHYSYTHNFWQWKDKVASQVSQIAGAAGNIEPLGESTTIVLSPYNVNAQSVRTRIWNGKDQFLSDNLTKLKGDHLIQFGGQFQHNFNYHQRTDNGASINYTPTYQIGGDSSGGNLTYSPTGIGGVATTGALRRLADTYYGIVTATQVANTYANVNGTLSLNAPLTAISANSTIPYYNIYATDTWKAKPTLTLNYGLSYALEMPPTERNGNQVMWTDSSGNPYRINDYLKIRQTQAYGGQIYNPVSAFALIKNVTGGGRKYIYDPYYKGFSPRISAAWTPKFKSEALNKIFGDGATAIRGGYGRIYGRINGDVEVLNPLLSPGLILATQCKYAQNTASSTASPTAGSGSCTQSNFNETTAYRFGKTTDGEDGLAPVLAGAALPQTLAQPYRPGFDGPGVSIASPVDPSLRPNSVDTINFSIQRQINRKMLVEVGYIGRLIHNEYVMKNPNQVPYNLTLGGQSFVSAYDAIEAAFGCTVAQCTSAATPAVITPQPFFETALGGPTSAYCSADVSCTAAVVRKQGTNFKSQSIFNIWQALDNNNSGTGATPGFTFARSLQGTATSNTTYGGAGQIVTGMSIGTGSGYGNYHGGYVTFKASNFHGITLQENLTWSKALGLGSYNQSTSSIAAEDNYNLSQQYGVQPFDQKLIFNTFIVYQTPWYKKQEGIVGRLAGGWTLSPVVVAGTGQPLVCTTNNSGQNFGGNDGATFTDSENCIFTFQPNGGAAHTHRNILGSGGIGTNVKSVGSGAVNVFTNPAAVWASTRPPILGLDNRDGGAGPIHGLGYLNVDLSIKKNIVVFEKYSIELTAVSTNVMNHLDFSNPSLSLQSPTNFGSTKTQGNLPRQIQIGGRINF